jgi:maltooligosyltrehalose trehalohydrolase
VTGTGRPTDRAERGRPDGVLTDRPWSGRHLPGGVLYQLQVRTFTPTGTFAAAVHHLAHLVDLGIDLVELLPVDSAHGLTAFVDACHARGLGVILHVRYGDLGPRSGDPHRAVLTSVGHLLREHHLDGLRVHLDRALADEPAARLFAQLAADVTVLSVQLGRPLSLIADSDVDGARLVVPAAATPAAGPGGDPGCGDFASLESLADVLVRRFAADPLAHDARAMPPAPDRISATISPGLRRVGATLLLTGPAIPILSMGEEWGAPARPVAPGPRAVPEPVMAAAGRRVGSANRGWWEAATGDAPADRDPTPLDWSELGKPQHRGMLGLYRRLIALRRQEPQLTAPCGSDTDVRQGDHFLTVRRGSCVVVANLGRTARRVNVAGVPRRVLLATELGVSLTHDAVDLPAESAAVLVCRRFDRH